MNIIIAFILVLIAGAMWFKRPLNISVTVTHKQDTPAPDYSKLQQTEDDKIKDGTEPPVCLDGVITELNKMMQE